MVMVSVLPFFGYSFLSVYVLCVTHTHFHSQK